MVEDLSMFTLGEIDSSIKAYRRGAENRFFPTSGQLRGPILEARKERAQDAKISNRPMPREGRPLMWWSLPPYLWHPHWQTSEIPEDWQASFHARLKAQRAAGVEGWAQKDFAGFYRKWGLR